MKRHYIFPSLIFILLITSCGPSAEEIATQTATAATAIAASWTNTPTLTPTLTHTPTFTPTITPTSTLTPTITPTPLGGGSGQIVLISGSGGGISLVDSKGTGMTFLANSPTRYAMSYYAWSPNGRIFAYPGDDGICVIDTFNFNVNCFGLGGRFAWSPDGSELAITDGGITILNVESGEKRTLVESEDFTSNPDWSPDGKKIVYDKKGDIYVVNVDGSNETLLVKNASYPIWSPDGSQIAYITGYISQPNQMIVMNADGTNKVRLTPSQLLLGNGTIAWSSDGKYIVYLVVVSGSLYGTFYMDLYKVEVATQKVSSLTQSHNALTYTISADGSAIAFTLEPKGEEKCNRSYVMNINGTILSEWNDLPCLGMVGPWQP